MTGTAMNSWPFILGGPLMAFTADAVIVGPSGRWSGERFERCPRCGPAWLFGRGPLDPDELLQRRDADRVGASVCTVV